MYAKYSQLYVQTNLPSNKDEYCNTTVKLIGLLKSSEVNFSKREQRRKMAQLHLNETRERFRHGSENTRPTN